MSKIEDGGPAFPIIGTHERVLEVGMTLRDYFAAHASEEEIQAMANRIPTVECVKTRPGGGGEIVCEKPVNWRQIARYMHADAMLAARNAK